MNRPGTLAGLPPVLVGIPAQPWMWSQSALALCNLMMHLPPGSGLTLEAGVSTIAANRNRIVETFLADVSFEYLLFLDSDMVPGPDVYARLVATGRDFVAASYWKRSPPFFFVHLPPEGGAFTHPTSSREEVQEASAVGFGCVLLHRRVFDGMARPYFEHPEPGCGEDVAFSARAAARGIRPYVHIGVRVGHMSPIAVDGHLASAWQRYPVGAGQVAAANRPEQFAARAEEVRRFADVGRDRAASEIP